MAKEYKLNLFEYLNTLEMRNSSHYKTLTEEQKKEIVPFVLMRWLSGNDNELQILLLNMVVNPYAFQFQKNHKELLVKLLAMCGVGHKCKHQYRKVLSKKTSSTPKIVGVIKDFFGYSSLRAIEALPLLSKDDILSFASQLGRQANEITVIKKELRTLKV